MAKQRMTIPEAEGNVGEVVVTKSFGEQFEEQHARDLKDALTDLDIDKLDKVIKEGIEEDEQNTKDGSRG